VFITGLWDVFGGIGGGGGGGSHPPSGGGSASNPYTNPNPTGNGSNDDPYTFHTWVLWPFPSDAQIGPYGPPKPIWNFFTLPGTNYCGPGGKGTPRNGVDQLCMKHDACYESSRINAMTNILYNYLQLPMPSHQVAIDNCNQNLCAGLRGLVTFSPQENAEALIVGAALFCIP
jgi:hypothetical protein